MFAYGLNNFCCGYYYDTETGLYYLNSRYYDPETGRFISPDDVDVLSDTLTQPNGLNLYAYCYNNPVMMTDPDGAFTLTWWQKMLIGLAFIVLGAVVTAVTGGSFAAAFVCGLTYAAKSAVSGAVMGAVMGGVSAAFSGEDIGAGAVSGFIDGFCEVEGNSSKLFLRKTDRDYSLSVFILRGSFPM